jgi:repressor LexA
MPQKPKSATSGLTAQQERVLNYIAAFLGSEGHPPSLEDIRDHLGLSAVSTVHEHVGRLVDKGYLSRRWNQSRSIEMAPGSRRWTRLVPLTGKLAAGQPLGAPDVEKAIAVPADLAVDSGDFAVTVADGSLAPHGILAGDTLVIGALGPRPPKGALVIATAADGAVVIRRVADGNAGQRHLGANSKVASPPSFTVLGRVVGLLRNYR